jgi:hypothetical protein
MKFFAGSTLPGSVRSMEVCQELLILREAERFRRLAALAWSKDTIYPKSEYVTGSSNGQCGVTNFGFGVWLCRLSLATSEQMAFEEGRIVNAIGSLVGDNHTWLRVDDIDDGCAHPDLSMRFDLAGDQFPGIDVPEVVQYDDYFYPDPHTTSGDRVYQADRVTRFSDYDTDRFAGRLGHFMCNVYAAASLTLPNH